MIELQNVSKYFRTNEGKKYILNNVSLTLPDKNIGILGRNGAGKSTLMRMLGRIEFPNKGKIISSNSFSWPLGLKGGFVGSMTGKANVKFVCRLYGMDSRQIKIIVNYVKKFSELESYFEMPVNTYSSGMKGKLSFGLSLAFTFDYMLIDETLSVGDARFKAKAKAALRNKIKSCHILLVSHDMQTLKELCQSGLLLHEGTLHYYEDIEDAIKHYQEINKQKRKK